MTQLACRPPIKMMIDDIQETRVLVDSLLKTKHYQRLGPEGIFAIIQRIFHTKWEQVRSDIALSSIC